MRGAVVAVALLAVGCGRAGETLPPPPVPLPAATTTADPWAALMARQGVPAADWEPLRLLAVQVCRRLADGRPLADVAAGLVVMVGSGGPLRSRSDVVVLAAAAVGAYCPDRQEDLDRLLTEGLPRTS